MRRSVRRSCSSCWADAQAMDRQGRKIEGRSCSSCPRMLTSIFCVGSLCYQPYEPFQIVLSVCTVDFDTPNFFAAARTVVRFSMMYTARSQARSSKLYRTHTTPQARRRAARSLSHVYEDGATDYEGRSFGSCPLCDHNTVSYYSQVKGSLDFRDRIVPDKAKLAERNVVLTNSMPVL